MSMFFSGFALSFGLITAIGAQNAFVLRQGVRREHVLPVVATCAFSDAILIATGVAGFGMIIERASWIEPVFRIGGAAFLFFYGVRSAVSAWRGGNALVSSDDGERGLWPVLVTCLALTWLNPHVYLDTVVLLGSVAAQYDQRFIFGAGAVMASFIFFFSLGFGARLLTPLFAHAVTWRALDALIAIFMWTIAASLLLH
ncbi:MAG: LysE/ArgO family amino acid transporter [Pseudomonadota bacterium]